jgi:glyoxylase-like metal-dependent hydrolase (beta-lactamase superfamily II)
MNIITIPCGMLEANCYIIENNKSAVIIDPGFLENDILDFINIFDGQIEYILLTHRHFDHLNAAVRLRELTKANIVINALDECGIYSDEKSLTNLCGTVYGTANISARADLFVSDGDIIKAGDMQFKVIETPGHSPGSISYLIDNFLFCGDVLFRGSIGRTDFPDSNHIDMIKSLEKLKNLPDDTIVYPGHGPKTTIIFEKMNNYYLF